MFPCLEYLWLVYTFVASVYFKWSMFVCFFLDQKSNGNIQFRMRAVGDDVHETWPYTRLIYQSIHTFYRIHTLYHIQDLPTESCRLCIFLRYAGEQQVMSKEGRKWVTTRRNKKKKKKKPRKKNRDAQFDQAHELHELFKWFVIAFLHKWYFNGIFFYLLYHLFCFLPIRVYSWAAPLFFWKFFLSQVPSTQPCQTINFHATTIRVAKQ